MQLILYHRSAEVLEIMKASLRKDRWQTLNLGEPKQYTSKAVQERWQKQRD